ncbi:amidohydrolase [Brachybacterium sp. YJGR34]|uniref:amidohydrolase family protein n=1 Tax=Brachybacterium sp. YJGR34 TaxID=2059911 RepID=UPI000E0B8E11|nr:amidohydrolase family protein [Brachybacterium sp. YJGR34]
MRCDAHLHLWDLERSPYAWLAGAPTELRRTFAPQEVLPALRELGIRQLVLVQADDTREDTAHLQRLSRELPLLEPSLRAVGVVAWMPLAEPAEVRRLLADAEAMERVVGVRHLTHDDPDPFFLRRPEVSDSLELLAAAGLPLDVPDAFPAQMAYLPELAAEHPELTIVLDHLGKPPLGAHPGTLRTWREMLARLAEHESVVAKLSGLATSGTGDRGDLVAVLAQARELLGAERLMYGSDWPIAPQVADHASGTQALFEEILTWPERERDLVLGGTAQRVYGLPTD